MEHILILASAILCQFLLFVFLFGVSIGITSSAIGLQIFGVTAGIEKYKSIIKKKKTTIIKILLLAN